MAAPRYSLVIPVYNSAPLLADTVGRCLDVLGRLPGEHELILVNDASRDGSWELARELARTRPGVLALDLSVNVGQHGALLLGMRRATGDRIVTLDDDGQNPPEEIVHLAAAADAGHDVVFGRFRAKQHSAVRIQGSRLVTWLNRRLYGLPRGLVVSNFRLLDRTVVDALCRTTARRPYITGLALYHGQRPANATVEHRARAVGEGNYGPRQIAALLATMLLSHPRFALPRAQSIALALALGGGLLVLGTLGGLGPPGEPGPLTTLGAVLSLLGWAAWFGLGVAASRPRLDDALVREVVDGSASAPVGSSSASVPTPV